MSARFYEKQSRPLAQHLACFIRHYRDTVINHLDSKSSLQDISWLSDLLVKTIRARGTIYICGNGGSHAIGRQLESSLLDELTTTDFPARIRWGIDFHTSQAIVCRHGYDYIFSQLLSREHAGPGDLVILISGSGNSSNLIVAAEHCREKNIPVAGLAAFHGGKLCNEDVVNLPIAVDVDDQQIGEDVIQSLLQICARYTAVILKGDNKTLNKISDEHRDYLQSGYARLDADLLTMMGSKVSEAYHQGRRVYVLAPEGGGVSLSAEHVAHNLNWDAVYEVREPPFRYLTSTPSGCDYSGIGNDRFLSGVVSCQQLSMASEDDVLIIFAINGREKAVQETVNFALERNMQVFRFMGKGSELSENDQLFDVESRSAVADLCQSAGHMLGRVVRLTLKMIENDAPADNELLSYLVDDDLAQRRLLHVVNGV